MGPHSSLDDRYRLGEGHAYLSGLHAIVRLILELRHADRKADRNTAGFISGYQGSPLGGLDLILERQRERLEDLSIRFHPGLNEDLAATSVWGSQLAHLQPGANVDGVIGFWYGKAPGVDRSADALRHANLSGVGPSSAAVLLVGDDPAAKSSTVPSASEPLLAALRIPTLSPGSIEDLLHLGRHAAGLSRHSGLWCAVKVVTAVADSTATVTTVDPDFPIAPDPVRHVPSGVLLAAGSVREEEHLLSVRVPAALAYSRHHHLNQVTHDGREARVGLISHGVTSMHLQRVLADHGLLDAAHLRVAKVGMLWPHDEQFLAGFADGLDEILVLEDRDPWIEDALLRALGAARIAVNVSGSGLRARSGELTVDDVVRMLVQTGVLPEQTRSAAPLALPVLDGQPRRAPAFCSGCPHNVSTRSPDDQLVGAGIGCHTMVVLHPDGHGTVTGMTHMGGEGAQWIGMSPFIADGRTRFVQNLGDGTFHHSGSLAIRASVAAGTNITYRLLFNEVVAMTGGQAIPGGMTVEQIVASLLADNVRAIAITSENPSRHRSLREPRVRVWAREDIDTAMSWLQTHDGTTVLVHDGACAAQRRRLRKRGAVPPAPARAHINARVCEGCSDCQVKSHCVSLEPTLTPYGRKTTIHHASCNDDLSCLKGDCPSFLLVTPGAPPSRQAPRPPHVTDPDMPLIPPRGWSVRLAGVGGTGVVTVAQILGMAAEIDGIACSGLDQIGLSQKGGAVLSDLRFGATSSPQATNGALDALVVMDLVGAVEPTISSRCDPERTALVVSSSTPMTADMTATYTPQLPDQARLLEVIHGLGEVRCAGHDAEALSERLFGTHMLANMIMVGAAYQAGLLPVSENAIREAIGLNGVAVDDNQAAFTWGRVMASDPSSLPELPALLAMPTSDTWSDQLAAAVAPGSTTIAGWTAEMRRWGGDRAARRFAQRVGEVSRSCGEDQELVERYAAGLFKISAYKDEYEVARLHLLPEEQARVEAVHGAGATVRIMLHPPILRALGVRRKIAFGPRARPLLRVLAASRRLRGTIMDPFGHAAIRRVERALPTEHHASVTRAIRAGASRDRILELCDAPFEIRGYEEVKEAGIARYRRITG